MYKSGFHNVDLNDPGRLVAALERRSTAHLYEPYRNAIVSYVQATSGPVVDVGAGGGHLVERLAASCPGRAVFGVEPSLALVGSALAAGRTVVLGTGVDLPLPDSAAGCVVLERVLQHVDDIPAVLAEVDRVLCRDGMVLLADPGHAEVRLVVPHLQDLADRLVLWRATAGTVSPAAVETCQVWLRARNYDVAAETFWCATGSYLDARVVTNFPEWAQLARDAGEDVSLREVASWEQHWCDVAEARPADTFWFFWPIVLTAARRPGAMSRT